MAAIKIVLLIALCSVIAIVESFQADWEVKQAWTDFKTTHRKNGYADEEESLRYRIFKSNYELIKQHNKGADQGVYKYRLGVNKFADLTKEEFSSIYKGLNGLKRSSSNIYVPDEKAPLPDFVDWRTKNLVTPVKDQGQCGSCWAFSAVASIEGQHSKATGHLVSLSEQNLVDCSEANDGCDGGTMDVAFEYIIKNHGIDTEDSYPYETVQGDCRFNDSSIGANISAFVDITKGDEDALEQASANIGPISVAIDANSEKFQLYTSGIYDNIDCNQEALDHGVTVVGYGTEGRHNYWIVKNSWGEDWGEKGYIRMSKFKDNQCGIATMASYPTV